MLREVDINEISDGNRYGSSDMVKIGCNNCNGCSECCKGMSDTIVLDPYDVARLTKYLNRSFESLIGDAISLIVVDGLILPVIQMNNEKKQCVFLNEEGRCSVHEARPGICRLFPLGRIYEEGGFSYFLQTEECPAKNKTKVKIKKWIGEADYAGYEKYVNAWHNLVIEMRTQVASMTNSEEIKVVCMKLLTEFYIKGYHQTEDVFLQIINRINDWEL